MLPNINYYLNNALSVKQSFSTTYTKLKKNDEKKINNNE